MARLELNIDLNGETQNKTVADMTSQLLNLNSAWTSIASSPGQWLLEVPAPGDAGASWFIERWEEVRSSTAHAHGECDEFAANNDTLALHQLVWQCTL